jgi:hypothetical protein
MTRPRRVGGSDLRGASQLAVEAVHQVTDLVEAVHSGIASPLATRLGLRPARARGIAGVVYGLVRWVTRHTGRGLDAALRSLEPALAEPPVSAAREAVVAALNGVMGDTLAARGNPLAIPLQVRHAGVGVPLERAALAAAFPAAGPRLVVLLHGLCMNDLQWARQGHDHGAALARDHGLTPVYLHYNTGLHVSENGRAVSALLEALVRQWPVEVEELTILGHSLGGLVARSACHVAAQAGHGWPRMLSRIVFLGTPHHGAPLERGGQWFHRVLGGAPYAAPFARLGRLRSAGITDLRHGSLLDEDWQGRDRFASHGDGPLPLPLPDGVACHAVAATLGTMPGSLREKLLAGDGLVPVASALGDHRDPARALGIPADRRFVATGVGHLDLLSRPEVYARLSSWLAG